MTLRQWQQLATPNLGGIFESRPGVQIKGERKLDLEEEQHNLSDLEEDGIYLCCYIVLCVQYCLVIVNLIINSIKKLAKLILSFDIHYVNYLLDTYV